MLHQMYDAHQFSSGCFAVPTWLPQVTAAQLTEAVAWNESNSWKWKLNLISNRPKPPTLMQGTTAFPYMQLIRNSILSAYILFAAITAAYQRTSAARWKAGQAWWQQEKPIHYHFSALPCDYSTTRIMHPTASGCINCLRKAVIISNVSK